MTVTTIEATHIPAQFRPLMQALAGAGSALSQTLRQGTDPAVDAGADGPKALDIIARDLFRSALRGAGLRWLATPDCDRPLALDSDGALALAITPLEGAAGCDTNAPVGTVFSLYPAAAGPEASFLRPARQQVGAGYIIHGPHCAMMLSFGDGVQHYRLGLDGVFRLRDARLRLPGCSFEFAIDAANYRHWARPIRAYIDDCLAGLDGPRATNFTMHWHASLVAETHRILTRGGIFLYPADARAGHGHGHLRLIFDGAPIAFLIEQAGGRATNGAEPILDQCPGALHQRTPLVFGSPEKVARVAAYHDLPEPEIWALFGKRGLFRA